MSEQLFKEFSETDVTQWITALNKELKGKDYRDELIWNSIEGIRLEPFYVRDETKKIAGPGSVPYRRTRNTTGQAWEIDQQIEIGNDPSAANKKALDALNSGASSISFHGEIANQADLEIILKDIGVQYIELRFSGLSDYSRFQNDLQLFLAKKSIPVSELRGAFGFDPIHDALVHGKWNSSREADLSRVVQLVKNRVAGAGRFRTVTVNASLFHNAGANTVEELAMAIAHGHEYIHLLVDAGVEIDEAASHLEFQFADGPDFYFTIAKHRAFRALWSTVISSYKPVHACSHNAFVLGTTSDLFLAHCDQHTNLLRFTSEAFASVVGGSDAFRVSRFNAATLAEDPFAERIGRNIQLVLREESHLDQIVDPAGGSYFLEHLTDELIAKAWELFKTIESKGGFLKEIESGSIQQLISLSAGKLKERYINRQLKMIGVNVFPDKNEKASSVLQEDKSVATGDHLPPIVPFRLSAVSIPTPAGA